MASTLNACLQRVGEILEPLEGFWTATSTGLAATTITDTKLITEAGMSRFLNGYVTRTALDTADRHRYVSAYNSATGVATVATYSNTSPTTVAALWFSHWNPFDIESAINRALENLEYEETFDGLTMVTNQIQYVLTTDLAWVTRRGQIQAVYRLDGTSGKYTEYPISGWHVYADQDVLTLDFSRASLVPASTDVVRIVSSRPYSTLGTHPIITGAGTTTCPLELVAHKAAYYLLERALDGAALEGRDALLQTFQRVSVRLSEEQLKHPATNVPQSAFKPARGGGWPLSVGGMRR